jgi:tRNA pseudouridine55 synthase
VAIDQIVADPEGWWFQATVGSGVYVRALVRDWGYLAGVAAHLRKLIRLRVGGFYYQGSVSLQQLEQAPARWDDFVQPWHSYLGVARRELDEAGVARVVHGDTRVLEELAPHESQMLALECQGRLYAIVAGDPWRYRVVFEEGL